jgi:hypothetical protein
VFGTNEGGAGEPVLRTPMKLLVWNCRGLGNALAVRGLLNCQKSVEADVLCLSETKMDERRMLTIRKKLGLPNMEVVDCEGQGVELRCCGGEESIWCCKINLNTILIWRFWRLVGRVGGLLVFMGSQGLI